MRERIREVEAYLAVKFFREFRRHQRRQGFTTQKHESSETFTSALSGRRHSKVNRYAASRQHGLRHVAPKVAQDLRGISAKAFNSPVSLRRSSSALAKASRRRLDEKVTPAPVFYVGPEHGLRVDCFVVIVRRVARFRQG